MNGAEVVKGARLREGKDERLAWLQREAIQMLASLTSVVVCCAASLLVQTTVVLVGTIRFRWVKSLIAALSKVDPIIKTARGLN